MNADDLERADVRLAEGLVIATGLAALGHQVIWTRRMIDLLGASTESTVRVFICFFLGLALGAASASWLIRRIWRPWRFLAGVELGVALCCSPIVALPYWSGWLWSMLGPERLVSGVGLVVKTGLSLCLVLPPAILMGMSLPIIVSAVCGRAQNPQQLSVRLYALNTVGGVIGLSLVAGFAIQQLGIPGSSALLVGVNVLVAIRCFLRSIRDRGAKGEGRSTRDDVLKANAPDLFRISLGAAGFSGAGVMALEVLALQLIQLSVPTSFYPTAAVLFCFILLLAAAASLTWGVIQRFGAPARLLPLTLTFAGLAVTAAPLILLSLGAARAADLAYAHTFAGFLGRMAGVALISVGPAALFCGFTFPLAVMLYRGSGEAAGRQMALLLAVNGLGGVAGAEVARSVLVPLWGVHVAMGGVGILYSLAAVVFGFWLDRGRLSARVVPIAGLAAASVMTLLWLRPLPLFYWSNAYRLIEARSGREGVLAVFEIDGFGRGLSFDNQYLLGGSGAVGDEQRQSHIPLLLHRAPERVCFAGLGTGITASGALQHAAVKSITAVELSELVVQAASRHFGDFNDHLDQLTNVVIHVEDARTYMAACRDRFDVIIGDLFTPWRPGEAGLASLEYFRESRGALRSGGVFCQWFPMHQLTEYEFNTIVSTFRSAFPHAYAFRNHLKTCNIPMALIGFKNTALDWTVVEARCREERQAGKLSDPLCRHAEGVAMLYVGELRAPLSKNPLNTLANVVVELDAGRNLVAPKPGVYYSYANDGNPYFEFIKGRRTAWASDLSVPERYRPCLEIGLLATRLEIAYDLRHPQTAKIEAKLRAQFPADILDDSGANWTLWAGAEATANCLRSLAPPLLRPPTVTDRYLKNESRGRVGFEATNPH